MKLKKLFGLASVALASTVLLAACGGSSDSSSSDDKTLKVGVMTLDDATEPLTHSPKHLADTLVSPSARMITFSMH